MTGATSPQDLAVRLVLLDADDDEAVRELPQEIRATVARLDAELAEALALLAEQAVATRGAERIELLADLAARLSGDLRATSASLPPVDAELVAEFIEEARRYLAEAEAGLLALESNPGDTESLGAVFRAFHTIKGTAGVVGFGDISHFAHAAEGLLSNMRDGKIVCAGRNATLALRSVDVLRAFIDEAQEALRSGRERVPPSDADAVYESLAYPDAADAAPPIPAAAVPTPDTSESRSSEPRARNDESAWMRVRTERLDRLIDMVGELVIAQSMVSQDPIVHEQRHEELRKKVGHATKIVRELQGLSMSLRMVPLKPTFQKLTRIVRDVAKQTKKELKFVTEGDETEIDRNMIDTVADPLVHMVRNAVDHGVEDAATRLARGKTAEGMVRLCASHAGGELVLELSDDGAGIDREVIARKAIEIGLITSDANMSDADVLALIFEPGFSTRDVVSDVSGRGVGMDVVKRGVTALKGRVEVSSRVGEGTTFTIRVPLTLAVTDGMLVRVGDERFIMPTTAIRTSLRPQRDMLATIAGRGEFLRVRDDNVPVFRIHHLFDVAGAEHDITRALVVIVDSAEGPVGFVVDALLAQQQVVSKSLTTLSVPGIAGGAILGDGQVGLILDPAGLVDLAHQTTGFSTAA